MKKKDEQKPFYEGIFFGHVLTVHKDDGDWYTFEVADRHGKLLASDRYHELQLPGGLLGDDARLEEYTEKMIEAAKKKKPGRPRRGAMLQTSLALTPEAAWALDRLAAANRAPKWEIVTRLILAAASGSVPAPKAVQGLAQEAADFLAAYPDQRRAEKALARSWSAALAMAKHDMA